MTGLLSGSSQGGRAPYRERVPLIPPGLSFWVPDLFVATNLVFALALYLWGARRAGRRLGARWPIGRTVAFAAAIGTLGVAYLGPFAAWAHVMFWPHMAQHLAVMMVAAPLIVLSSPVRLVFLNLGRSGRQALIRGLRSRVMDVLTNPILTWFLLATVLLGIHTSAVMDWIVTDHDAMDYVERPIFLVVALLYYYPLIGGDLIGRRPPPSVRLVSLGLMMIPETVLGMVIHFAPVALYPAYVEASAFVPLDALTDQKLAGAMMWAMAMVLDGVWMMVAALEWWRDQEAATRRMERQEIRERAGAG